MNLSNHFLKACRFLAPMVSCSTEHFSWAVHCVRSPYFWLVLSMSPDNLICSLVGFVLWETANNYSVFIFSLTACALLASPGIRLAISFLGWRIVIKTYSCLIGSCPTPLINLVVPLYIVSIFIMFFLRCRTSAALSIQADTNLLFFKRWHDTISGFIPFIKNLVYLLFQFLSSDLIFSWNY